MAATSAFQFHTTEQQHPRAHSPINVDVASMAGPLSDTPLPKDAERGGDHAHSHTTDTRGRTDKQVGGQTKTTQCGLLCAARRAERNVGLFPSDTWPPARSFYHRRLHNSRCRCTRAICAASNQSHLSAVAVVAVVVAAKHSHRRASPITPTLRFFPACVFWSQCH